MGFCGAPVFALVEEESCFLTSGQTDLEADTVDGGDEVGRRFAVDRSGDAFQTFFGARNGVVAFGDRLGLEDLLERFDDVGLDRVGPLSEGLHDDMRAVAVDDEAGHQIGIGKDDAVGVGVRDDAFAEVLGTLNVATVEANVRYGRLLRQHAEDDFGRGTVVRGTKSIVASVEDTNNLSGLGVTRSDEIATIDPGTPGQYFGSGPLIDFDFDGFGHELGA